MNSIANVISKKEYAVDKVNLQSCCDLFYGEKMGFITEADTENYLKSETRHIALLDGTTLNLTMFKLVWRSFDYLIQYGDYTEKELVKLAMMECQEKGYAFEECFPDLLAYIHRHVRRSKGID